jgi:hypothetical protein
VGHLDQQDGRRLGSYGELGLVAEVALAFVEEELEK